MATEIQDNSQTVPVADRVLRTITDTGGFRVITLRTTDMVREAMRLHRLSDANATVFGELLTGAILLREAMAPGLRMQVIVQDADRATMVADAHPNGDTRGVITRLNDGAPLALTEGALLKVIRTMPRGRLHQSVVEAATGRLSLALAGYLQNSAQLASTVVVSTIIKDGHVVAAGGYLVQALPEVEKPELAVMTARLEFDFAYIDDFLLKHDADAGLLRDELLYRMPSSHLAESELAYRCQCSEAVVFKALASLPQADIEDLVSGKDPVEMHCDYCDTMWPIATSRLRTLLQRN